MAPKTENISRDRTGTVSGTVPARNKVGSVRSRTIFLSRSWNMLSIFSVLSETVATVSLSAPPTVAHIRR